MISTSSHNPNRRPFPILLLFSGTLLGAVFLLFFGNILSRLINIWYTDGNYSHGFFVPIIIGYILWSERNELRNFPIKPFWPALSLVIIAALLLLAGQLTIHRYSQFMALFLFLASSHLLVFGTARTQRVLIPILFIIFMFPLPELFRRTITAPLQIFSSYVSVEVLKSFGYTIAREGNIIQLPDLTLSVAEACSGLRSLVALTFLAATAGYFLLTSNLKRFILLLCAIPIAILVNWLRIVGTVLLANHWGIDFALGFFHSFSGILIFGLATFLLCTLAYLLYRQEKPAKSPTLLKQEQIPTYTISPTPFLAISAVLLSVWFYGNLLENRKPGPPLDLSGIPLHLNQYQGAIIPIDPEVTSYSGVTRDLTVRYSAPHEPPIDIYLGYYRTSKEMQGFFHGSDVCLPGSGWSIKNKQKIVITSTGEHGNPPEAMLYTSNRNDLTQLLITWLQTGDLIGTDSRIMRVSYIKKIMLTMQYDDLIKIMIQTVVGPQETNETALARLQSFITELRPHIDKIFAPLQNK